MAGNRIIIDTGPLVAFLDKSDQYNYWTGEIFSELTPPFLTCEAVLAETLFLMQRGNLAPGYLFKLLERGSLLVQPIAAKQIDLINIGTFLEKYKNLPASFADACLVWLYENEPNGSIVTLDHDFTIYRTANGNLLKTIMP